MGAATARYDGHADWYDEFARADAGGFMAHARAALAELLPPGPGIAVDVGCGTGLHAPVLTDHGFRVLGLDYSADQLRIARGRLPVVRADARALPLAGGSVAVAASLLTHTDLDGFDRLVAECARVLRPGGALVYVGVHPCFVNPWVEPVPDGRTLHPGYRAVGWQGRTPFTGEAVRARVGVHHLPLAELLTALARPGLRLDRVLERGPNRLPDLLAVRLTRGA
jgi:SAM-dependent methyltransferase